MARWASSVPSYTTTAIADTSAITSGSFHALQGGVAGQRTNVLEVSVGGQATASAVQILLFARTSTVGAGTLAGARTAALDPATAALTNPVVSYNTVVTTPPQRAATLSLLNMSFNAFGGGMRWVAAPGEEIGILGVAVNAGEVVLSGFTGTAPGLVGSHMVFEPF